MKLIGEYVMTCLAIVLLAGCGGGGDSYYASSVAEVSVRDRTIEPGSPTSLRIRLNPGAERDLISTDEDPSYTSEPFGVTVILPVGVSLVQGSSRLTDNLFGDVLFGNPDPKEPIQIAECTAGTTAIRYFFEENEFADPVNSINSFYLKLDVVVPQSANGTEAGAAISWNRNGCDDSPEEVVRLVVGS